jgi:nucleoside-diphosphate-sugar epimerase
VASTLTITGTGGSLTCDFARSIVLGTGNSGTEALEKVLNPIAEGGILAGRGAMSTVRRVTSGTSYAGLPEIIDSFYQAVEHGRPSPVSPEHLLHVTRLFESMVDGIEHAVSQHASNHPPAGKAVGGSRIIVTGARGFLGSEIVRALAPVRGLGRGPSPRTPHLTSWTSADLSQELDPKTLEGIDVVVHTAAEVNGGYPEHQRNSIDATRHLLAAMHAAGVRKLVHVSSLSVIRPPHFGERQDEATPRPEDPRPFGPYTWGKCAQEAIVEREAAGLGIETRIIRPGALLDPYEPEFPGLMGRRLFGRWHLGLGRPGLPIAVVDVDRCGDIVAWCATHFDEAPRVVNLLDPSIQRRADLIAHLGKRGWKGSVIWVPISFLAGALTIAKKAIGMITRQKSEPLKAWAVLRPRRYDTRLSSALFDAVRREDAPTMKEIVIAPPLAVSGAERPVATRTERPAVTAP